MEIDSCAKLLDNGWSITLFKNEMGTYSAVATKGDEDDIDELSDGRITDDFTPSKAVYRLTEKMFGNIWDGVAPDTGESLMSSTEKTSDAVTILKNRYKRNKLGFWARVWSLLKKLCPSSE